VQLSITLLTAVVVGGVATYVGPAVGALAVVYVSELFVSEIFGVQMPGKDHPQYVPALFGLTLIVLMIVAPGGVVGLVKQGWSSIKRRSASRPEQPAPESAAA
jgi:branched-chain amino acid transport system permease protein